MDEQSDKRENPAPLFQVLSQAKIKKKAETDRRLPLWLANPTRFASVNSDDTVNHIDEFSDYIDEDLRMHLKKNILIDKLFPVQLSVIPNLSAQFKASTLRRPNDVCVSSPTGSGKTLAYVIPIVNHLKSNLTHSLRAMVVLPTKDLALQVYKTFDKICKATKLRCLLAEKDLSEFKRVKNDADLSKENSMSDKHLISKSFEEEEEFDFSADIIVSTPGTLVDLIQFNKWFSVDNLEILVIDEADRLMNYQKHGWLEALETKIFTKILECPCKLKHKSNQLTSSDDTFELPQKRPRMCYTSICGCCVSNSWRTKYLHKLLFSATLSSDPQLLMHMNLFQPRLFLATKSSIASTRIRNSLDEDGITQTPVASADVARVNTRSELLTNTAIPEQLSEKMFIIESKERLFCMWYMFHELQFKKVICFTNQLSTSFRLCKFLNEIQGVRAVEFSSNMKQQTREKFLIEFVKGKIEVIVSTDLMARGMDVADVKYVISYDMPTSEISYVHRIGRTARAGKEGVAITLVDTKQLVHFKKIVQLAHKKPNSMRLGEEVEEMKIPSYLRKASEKRDLFESALENFQDKIGKRKKFIKN